MKALQEKRISLRSLWRRSLVILSVVALAFAFVACGDDSGDGDGVPGDQLLGGRVAGISIIQAPTNTSSTSATQTVFEGLPVDLTGIRVAVIYDDNSRTFLDASYPFIVDPPINIRTGTTPRTYRVGYEVGGFTHWASYSYAPHSIRPLLGSRVGGTGSEGIRYTGRLTTREYYSDDVPNFNGVTIELRHPRNAVTSGIVTEVDHENALQTPFAVPRAFPYWSFALEYESPTLNLIIPTQDPRIATTDDWFPPTIGAPALDLTSNYIRIPIDNIWYAERIEIETPTFASPIFIDGADVHQGMTLLSGVTSRMNPNGVGPGASLGTARTNYATDLTATEQQYAQIIGFPSSWLTDTNRWGQWRNRGAWTLRFREANPTVTVYYRGAPAPRTWTFQEVMASRPQSLNSTGQVNQTGQQATGWDHMVTVIGPLNHAAAAGPEPVATVNYRGREISVPVNIYSQFLELEVEPADGGDVFYFDRRPGLDIGIVPYPEPLTDPYGTFLTGSWATHPAGGPHDPTHASVINARLMLTFARNIVVRARYESARNPGDTATRTLTMAANNTFPVNTETTRTTNAATPATFTINNGLNTTLPPLINMVSNESPAGSPTSPDTTDTAPNYFDRERTARLTIFYQHGTRVSPRVVNQRLDVQFLGPAWTSNTGF